MLLLAKAAERVVHSACSRRGFELEALDPVPYQGTGCSVSILRSRPNAAAIDVSRYSSPGTRLMVIW